MTSNRTEPSHLPEGVDDNGVQKVEIIGFLDPEGVRKDVAGREVTVRKSIVLGNGRININELDRLCGEQGCTVKSMDVATADEKDIKAAQSTLNKTGQGTVGCPHRHAERSGLSRSRRTLQTPSRSWWRSSTSRRKPGLPTSSQSSEGVRGLQEG